MRWSANAVKILLVENPQRSRNSLHKGLARSGFSVDAAGGGEAGLRDALGFNDALVTLDPMLPVPGGPGVLKPLCGRGTGVSRCGINAG